jgi:hypothetical protein
MAEGDNQAAHSPKMAGAQRPEIKPVFMIHLDIERMRIEKPKKCRKKTPRVP